ncbi:hypothetical protein ACH4UY_15310 [Streptomyces longwoodensis]|uniref:Uncharacterized protein n=1 Tax=Streptomyces rameus TaxID=68261 RepID=A0ABP6MVU9_9ACTN
MAVGLTAVAMGAGIASAEPAAAGGIGVIGSPAFDNTCITIDHTSKAVAETVHTSGFLNNVAQLPLSNPYQHCGGADLGPLLLALDVELVTAVDSV